MNIIRYAGIHKGVFINGEKVFQPEQDLPSGEYLRKVYEHLQLSYSKFFKMDDLSKLAYLTSEMTLADIDMNEDDKKNMGLFICNSTASLDTDRHHQDSISDKNNYIPSPSVFVYTLPNIMLGEIAIRHKIKGENYCLIFDKFDAEFLHAYSKILFENYGMHHLLIGWVDLLRDDFHSFLAYVSKDEKSEWEFTVKNLVDAYKNELK